MTEEKEVKKEVKEEAPLIINGVKVEFKESFKAREWLSQQKAKYREGIESQIPALIQSLKTSWDREYIMNLETKSFLALWYAYQRKVGMMEDSEDFL